MKLHTVCGISLAFLGLSAPASAQDVCGDEATIFGCFSAVLEAREAALSSSKAKNPDQVEVVAAAKKETVKADAAAELADAKPGADTSGGATASTLTDLIPLINALGILSPEDSVGNQLGLDLNLLLKMQDVDSRNTQFKLLVNTQPEPLGALVESFDESVRDARKAALQKEITTLGDAELRLNWSLVSSRFGRDFSIARRYIYPIFDGAARAARASDAAHNSRADFEAFRQGLAASKIDGAKSFSSLPEPARSELRAATIKAAQARADMTELFGQEIARVHLDRIADLVEEQPQLLVSLSHKSRDDIVGPDETSAGLTWEWSHRNLSAFLHDKGKPCLHEEVNLGGAVYARCVKELGDYLAQDFNEQWRFKLEAKYKRVGAVTFADPEYEVEFALPKTKRIEVTFGMGREFSGKPDLGRLDFEVSYDSNVDNDTSNKDRLKAAITLTKRMGDLDVPFSVVYANKNQFLGEVDHQIGMHVGVKFRQAK
jgi:hypothetical protein